MLKRTFNPFLIYFVVVYLRMSSDRQNPRSPEQQLDEIKRRLQALGYNWQICAVYRDDGISGRLLRKRSGFQQMLRDIKSGAVQADLILVDTLERFGRVEELPTIRKELFERNGVMVLTADSNFADPNTPGGKALGMIEAMRATEDGRVKAHNVLRGKRDAARLKHWPGGSPPFGFKLKSVMKNENGREVVDYCMLIPDPEASWIIKLLYEQAEQTGWGTVRLAKMLNGQPDIPEKFKPFQPETIGYWLDQTLYYGTLLWERNSTGVLDDTRVVEANAADEVLRVPEFCEPIVPRELWDKVQALPAIRRQRHMAARAAKAEAGGKLIAPLTPGMAINYLLSGLLYCGSCGLRMTASSTGVYTNVAGEQRRYTSYVCPGYLGGHCTNCKRVPEQWVREMVVSRLRELLFPSDKS